MAEKVTIMVLNTVDLQCSSCYKKVKKVLCKFPQIRDQVYDEKNNKVTIKVLCCSPEKIRDKLCCKGGKVIKSIEILEPPKPKPPPEKKEPEKPKPDDKPKLPPPPKQDDKPKPKPPPSDKPKEAEKPKPPPQEKPKEAEKPKPPPSEKPKEAEKPKPPPSEKPKEAEKTKPKDPDPAPKAPEPVPVNVNFCEPVQVYPGYPPMYPSGACCGPCSQGYSGGPCYHGYGRPVPPPPAPCYDGYGYGYPYRGSKCCVSGDYFSEENPQGCTIM